jgi:hypothetical protein
MSLEVCYVGTKLPKKNRASDEVKQKIDPQKARSKKKNHNEKEKRRKKKLRDDFFRREFVAQAYAREKISHVRKKIF